MITVSLYDESTGLFTGQVITGTDDVIAQNVPPGHAWVEGAFDSLTSRIDLATGVLTSRTPPEQPVELRAALVRRRRAALLAACDWRVVQAAETGVPMSQAWIDYRQALRDVPEQPGFPDTIDWPVPPA